MRMSWTSLCHDMGLEIPFEAYFSQIGRPFQDILKLLGITENLQIIEEHYMRNSMAYMSLVSFYPGVREVLTGLRVEGRKIGIVTSKDGQRTRILVDQLGIVFDTLQTPCDAYRGKPAPDHLLVAMAETGVDPAETVYIGDMDSDFEAAMRAGVDYIHASWGYGEPIPAIPAAATLQDLRALIA